MKRKSTNICLRFNIHKINFTQSFDKSYKKNIKNNNELIKRTSKAIKLLMNNPFFPSLRSHKVNTKRHGQKWSSYISGDIRIIWEFGQKNSADISLLDIGTHKLYK